MADAEPIAKPSAERAHASREGSGPTDGSASSKWDLVEVLIILILAAESLRIVGSVVAGIVNGLSAHVVAGGQQLLIGRAAEAAANFSDGPGIVLLLLSLGLLWWRAEHWTGRLRATKAQDDGGLPEEATQVHRIRGLTRWLTVLFVLASLGALAYLGGTVLVVTAVDNSASVQAQVYANDSFSLAYFIIAVAGLIGSLRLASLCKTDIDLIDTAD